ncbi:MAG TPA: PilZ domain-containing protein [Myxococcaceae bacterium]|nr:PilZ domain-containing protein [Myxococcaceae bacterium]
MRDRRSHLRFDKVFPVYVTTDDGMTRGIARNISATGLFVETREVVPLGGQLRVTFAGEDGTEMTCKCEVRYQVAVHFGKRKQDQAHREGHSRGIGLRIVSYELHDNTTLFGAGREPVMH